MGISSALGSSALLPAGLGFRNLVMNGDFRINQRAFTSTSSSTQYGFDRWSFAYSGGTTTSSAQTFTVGSGPASNIEAQNFWRLAVTGQSAAGDLSFGYHYIEDVRTLASKQVTISFYAKASSGTPKIAVELSQKFGTGGSPSSDVNTYAGQVTLSTSWARYSVTVSMPSISGKTIGTTANTSSTALLLWLSAGSTYGSRTGSIGIQNNTFDIWGIQVESNYQPTPFEYRPIGVELTLCQRYYWESTLNRYMIHARDTNLWFMNPILPTTMRIGPATTTTYAAAKGGVHSANGDVSIYSNGWIGTSGSVGMSVEGAFPDYVSLYLTGFAATAGAAGSLITESNGYFTYFRFNAEYA